MGLRAAARTALLLALLSLCLTAKAVTVHLGPEDPRSTVLLHVGDRLRVELPSEPARGLHWTAKALDASHLELLSKDIRPQSGRLNASGTQVFVWKAIAPGKADIAITYTRRGDDKTIPPLKQVNATVEVVPGLLTPPISEDDALLGPNLERVGAYTGRQPCGDCTGIAIDLTLFARDARRLEGTVFEERRRYQGAPGGDRTIAGTGRWAVVHGTYADPSLTVYALQAPGGSLENWKLDGDRLLPLDPQMLPIPGPPGRDGVLHRIPGDAPPPAAPQE